MEVHSQAAAKRLWKVFRITFFMIRKGLISKRKMIMDMNLMMKKGKLLRKSLSNLMSSKSVTRGGIGSGGFMVHDYEFSCSNSPNPLFFNMPKRKHHFNFPCINAPEVFEEEPRHQKLTPLEVEGNINVPKDVVTVPKTPEYSFSFRFDGSEFVTGERKSPLLSPFSVRVSNYSALEESDEGGNGQVDDQAEDFIKRFYEQLSSQSRMQLLQCQEM